MFALVDCNSFYASCERLFRPDLRDTPIVVLSNNDGCVIARCDIAKARGIPMGGSYFQIQEELSRNGVIAFSSNYTLYGDLSRRVMRTLEQMAPAMEVYSIDEAFLDLSAMTHFDLEAYSRTIRETVLQNVGIPTCVGVAPTKALAKAANRVAKRFKEKTGGVWVLDTPQKIEKCLQWLPIEDVWGIGHMHSERLKALGVKTAKDFLALPSSQVRKMMSIVGERLHMELQGISCLPLSLLAEPKKSICTSRSFGQMLESLEPLESAVASYASTCARKLRTHKLCSSTMSVFLHTNPFQPTEPQRYVHASYTFPVPTQFTEEVVSQALRMLRSLWKNGYRYKKAGVIMMGNIPENQVQGDLFDRVDREKAKRSMCALDAVNRKFGRDALRCGIVAQGDGWKLRRNKLSSCFSTNWNELMLV